ncbi:MAG: hypothetical protein ACRD9L_01115 [Bryobacteraceae bacterium]
MPWTAPVAALLFVCAASAADRATPDALAIVQRSIAVDQSNWERAKDYTFHQHVEVRDLDARSGAKAVHSDTYDVTILYGRPYERRIQRDGKPLSERQARKEQDRLDEALAERRKESQDVNGRRRREYEERRRKQRLFLKELPAALDFRLIGEEAVDGHPAWVLSFEPKPSYRPHNRMTSFLPKVHGRAWIDKAGCHWVRLNAETTGTISFGLFLARLGPGAKMMFLQKRVNDEIWLPSQVNVQGEARLALVKKERAAVDITYSNYRKFQTDSRIVTQGQAP